MSKYNFETGEPTAGASIANYDAIATFTGMIWKGTPGVGATNDFAGFAVRPGCAAARFCSLINRKYYEGADAAAVNALAVNALVLKPTETKQAYKDNLSKKCIDTTDGMLNDFCYSKS